MIYDKANKKTMNSLGDAYNWWMNYSSLIDEMYIGMNIARTDNFPDWHKHVKYVMKEYSDFESTVIPLQDIFEGLK